MISAATERAMRAEKTSAMLVGQQPTDKLLQEAGETAAAEVDLIGDAQGSAPYKRQLVRVYVERALRQALEIDGDVVQ